MAASHLIALVTVSLATGIIFSFSMRETTRQRVRFSLWVAATMVLLAVLAGWLMAPFHR